MIQHLWHWTVHAATAAAAVGATLLVQSTLLTAAGLLAAACLRRRSALVRSTILRATLVAVIGCPLAACMLARSGADRYSIALPAINGYALLTALAALVAALLLVRLALAIRIVSGIRHSARSASLNWIEDAGRCARTFGVATPSVLQTDRFTTPCLVGFQTPVILLPTAAQTVRHDVLVHELAHLRRRDCLWHLFCHIARALLWFQPLMWLLTRRIEQSADEVCDDFVVAYGGDRAEYARALVDIAERHQMPWIGSACAVGMASLKSTVSRRVVRIMDNTRTITIDSRRPTLLLILTLGVGATLLTAMLAATISPALADNPSAPAPAPAAAPASAAPPRLAVPDPAAQSKKGKLIRDVFGNFNAAPLAERPAIAAKLLDQGMATADDPTARYVLLKDGGDLAASAGDAATAMRAATLLASIYAVDPGELKLALLRKAATAATTPVVASAVAQEGLNCASEAVASGNYDLASRFMSSTEQAARTAKDVTLILSVQSRAADIKWLQSESLHAKTAEEKLNKTPTDPDANHTLGRYFCLVRGDWTRGLIGLSKGSNPAYHAAAAADLANPTTTDKQVVAGDLWWDIAEKETSGAAQRALRRRAGYWYSQALVNPQFAGLSRALVEKKLSQIPPVGPGEAVAEVPPAAVQPYPGPAPAGPVDRQTKTFTNTLGMKFVGIEPGEFMMGSPVGEKERLGNETQHRVKLTRAFMMACTPVTHSQWRSLMGNNPSNLQGDDLPVEQVTWDDAVAFCKKLSDKEGVKYRLPTEAEWEYACRAGTKTEYYTGDGETALKEAGWYAFNSGAKTHPVGQKKPNAWGLYDMHGNVWQWCSDYYGDYPTGDVVDPKGSTVGDKDASRVLRGGSYGHVPAGCRAAYRHRSGPEHRGSGTGFRVCLDTTQQSVVAGSGRAYTPPPGGNIFTDASPNAFTNTLGMKLVPIPAGEFMMGSPETEVGRENNEKLHRVKITKAYFIAATLVTQANWKAIMGRNPSGTRGDDLPVDEVSWHDAVAFCEKLSAKEGKHYRLPTEAEWEYACRAGTQTPFSFGDGHIDDFAWYQANSQAQIHNVATKKPNRWGLFDMQGNLWQWCSDWYGVYNGDGIDPKGAEESRFRVMRGGSFQNTPASCRAACRHQFPPDERGGHIGFRVCVDTTQLPEAAPAAVTPTAVQLAKWTPLAAAGNPPGLVIADVEAGDVEAEYVKFLSGARGNTAFHGHIVTPIEPDADGRLHGPGPKNIETSYYVFFIRNETQQTAALSVRTTEFGAVSVYLDGNQVLTHREDNHNKFETKLPLNLPAGDHFIVIRHRNGWAKNWISVQLEGNNLQTSQPLSQAPVAGSDFTPPGGSWAPLGADGIPPALVIADVATGDVEADYVKFFSSAKENATFNGRPMATIGANSDGQFRGPGPKNIETNYYAFYIRTEVPQKVGLSLRTTEYGAVSVYLNGDPVLVHAADNHNKFETKLPLNLGAGGHVIVIRHSSSWAANRIGVQFEGDRLLTSKLSGASPEAPAVAAPPSNYSVLHFLGHSEERPILHEIASGRNVVTIPDKEATTVLANPNCFANVAIVAFGGNEIHNIPGAAFSDDVLRRLRHFVENGGDLITFGNGEPAGRMQFLNTLFGLRAVDGAHKGAVVLAPNLLAAMHAAGWDAGRLGDVVCVTGFEPPAGAQILIRASHASNDIAVGGILPVGKGRVIFLGNGFGKVDVAFDEVFLRYVYNTAVPAPGTSTVVTPASGNIFTDGPAAAKRNILLLGGNHREEPLFRAIPGASVRAVASADIGGVLARPDAVAGAHIIVWGANVLAGVPEDVLTNAAWESMRRFMEAGGDLVIFEQSAGNPDAGRRLMNNTTFVEKGFGVKVHGGAITHIAAEIPELGARIAAAGLNDDFMAKVVFFNGYTVPPGATLLLRAGNSKGLPVAAEIAVGKGRLILVGAGLDALDMPLDKVLFDYIFGGNAGGPRTPEAEANPARPAPVPANTPPAGVNPAAGVTGKRNILLFEGGAKEDALFRAVPGANLRVVKMADAAGVLARPDAIGEANIVVWGCNTFNHVTEAVWTPAVWESMRRQMEAGGDVIIFGQVGGNAVNGALIKAHWDFIEKNFGATIRGGPIGATAAKDELAVHFRAAGLSDELLASVAFSKAFVLPANATVLVKGGKAHDVPVVAVIPVGKGRLILDGGNFDNACEPFERALFEYIYGANAGGAHPPGAQANPAAAVPGAAPAPSKPPGSGINGSIFGDTEIKKP